MVEKANTSPQTDGERKVLTSKNRKHAPIVTTRVKDLNNLPEEFIGAAAAEAREMTAGERLASGLFLAAGTLAVGVNFVGLSFQVRPSPEPSGPAFDAASPLGATAIGMAKLIGEQRYAGERSHFDHWIIIGMLMLAVAALIRLRAAVRHLGQARKP